jgi:hypothetical protein
MVDFTGLQVAEELNVTTVKAVEVDVTVDVCFKNVGRTACKMVLRKIRLPATGWGWPYEP